MLPIHPVTSGPQLGVFPHRQFKIWFSCDPSEFLPQTHALRIVAMHVRCRQLRLTVVYSSRLLNSRGEAARQRFLAEQSESSWLSTSDLDYETVLSSSFAEKRASGAPLYSDRDRALYRHVQSEMDSWL